MKTGGGDGSDRKKRKQIENEYRCQTPDFMDKESNNMCICLFCLFCLSACYVMNSLVNRSTLILDNVSLTHVY